MEKNKFKVYSLHNFKELPQVKKYLTKEQQYHIEVVGNVLPFKVNNYVVDELIDWENIPNDPVFQLTFPQKAMLSDEHYSEIETAVRKNLGRKELKSIQRKIRYQLNPHPDGQEHNVPIINGKKFNGVQHKYDETVLFFPSNGQTCHAYCTFCFRWPQFVGHKELKFATKDIELLIKYLKQHPEVTDILFTGGDPMTMSAKSFANYINPLINADLPNLKNIRIGSKVLTYWPYKFLTDDDSDDMIKTFELINKSGLHLSFMAHFNNPAELKTDAVKKAIKRIISTGAHIRTQAPIMHHINASANEWAEMWKKQVSLGCIPYYMFIPRDTGAQDYFAIELHKAWKIFRDAYKQVSGIARTVRGPSMSANPGKVQITGVSEINGKKVFVLRFIQGRNPDWVARPFFAEYNEDAIWLNELKPAFGKDKFFYEEEFEKVIKNNVVIDE